MTNTQLYLAIGLPWLIIFASMVASTLQVWGIRAEITAVRGEMAGLRKDVREDVRAIVEKIDVLTGKVAEMDTRLAVLEERVK